MKKKYLQPEVGIMGVELNQLMSASGPTIEVDNDTAGNPEEADSRFLFKELDLPRLSGGE